MKVYFEAGANNGIDQSRTLRYRDDEEWIGILVEPDARAFRELITSRNNSRTHIFFCALTSSTDTASIDLLLHPYTLMSMVVDSDRILTDGDGLEKQTVPARTVQSILDELSINNIDEFFLDVEGYEVEVLKGIGGDCDIKFLEVECHYHKTSKKIDEIQAITEQASRLGLFPTRINLDEGHPKLEFRK